MVSESSGTPDLRHVTIGVQSGDVELHSEALVNDSMTSPPVLFLSGAEEPSSRWPKELLQSVASRTGGAIWFDTRDIGQSTWVEEPYGIDELVVDALLVMDSHDVASAHVVGRGMGGQVAQLLALARPDRVSSLTLVSSTPGRREEFGDPDEWLVDKMSERLFAGPPLKDGEVVDWIVEQLEWFNGPVFAFDRDHLITAVGAEVANGWRGPNGHGLAVVNAPDIVDELATIDVPALVVHGTSDPVYPVLHAQALAQRLPNSHLELIEGLGHELPVELVPQLVELLTEHVLETGP